MATVSIDAPYGNYLRVRGEYTSRMLENLIRWELPPRARRILGFRGCWGQYGGTTSACAENTVFPAQTRPAHRNYLRVRGEYIINIVTFLSILELPPRARRIRPRGTAVRASVGTTSACAENTARTASLAPS